ncbi:3-methyladenine DNA glycosylase [Rheinheimera sp. SA_1]|jgi:3-methyladenine DNA glycosylase Tag|uniref:DNA-3-methyladenine glycosylase I n=1 Tax=Rheinheimera sp. SA_1 TaxID=1827365 RepID=UPI00080061AA|nr:DNA-3-methyladenine glycosylase I [Rheinheimera sp. SA_1]OBP16682.1 3-methyladenine DNA glycosylase [Rheinheimera sp. SA_1]
MAQVEKFPSIYQRAVERKGGEAQLQALLGHSLSSAELLQYSDADWLEALTKKVFQSGFVWRVVENKWPGFREVFFDFAVEKMLMLPDEMLAQKAQDPRIIRNGSKVLTIRHNALMIHELAQQHGSFAAMVAHWPTDNIIGLWELLKKRGARLGGNTGAYALRAMGKDTFLLSQDVEAYLRAYQVIDGGLTSKSNLAKIQAQFNQWQQQSGFNLQQISRIVAMSVGDNYAGLNGVTGSAPMSENGGAV